MLRWLKQKFESSHHSVFLIHHSNNKDDASFLQKAIESQYKCKVEMYSWNNDNPFTFATNSAENATLTLFVLSKALLDDLDRTPDRMPDRVPEGRYELYQRVTGPQPKNVRSIWKIVIIDKEIIDDNRISQDKLEELDPYNLFQREDSENNFIHWIGTHVKLPRLSVSRTEPTRAMGTETPELESEPPQPEDSASSKSPYKYIWAVPSDDEHRRPEFVLSAVKSHDDRRIPGNRVLEALHNRFNRANRVKCYQILHGLPIIGKTAIAIRYAHEYGHPPNKERSDDPYRVVLWLDAKEGLDKSYKALSQYHELVQYVKSKQQGDQHVPSDQIQGDQLQQWLQAEEKEKVLLNDEGRWLLIIDGCRQEDFDLIDKLYWREWQPNRGDILITMHDAPPPREDQYKLEVLRLSAEEGVSLLAKVTGRPQDYEPGLAKKIVESLNGLPLAIELAGFSIGRIGDYGSFFERYNDNGGRSSEAFGENKKRVTQAFQSLLDEVKAKNGDAYKFLIRCALLAQKPLPVMLMKKLMVETFGREDVDDIFLTITKTLGDFFLLDPPDSKDEEWQIFTIPAIIVRLVYEMKIQPEPEEQLPYVEQVVRAVSAALPQGKWDRWSSWQYYLPHIQKCIDHMKEFDIANSIEVVRLFYTAGCFYMEQPQYEFPAREQEMGTRMNAKDLLLQALIIRRKLLHTSVQNGDDYPDLPTCRYALAELYHRRFLYQHTNKKTEPLKIYKKIEARYNSIVRARSSSPRQATRRSNYSAALSISSPPKPKNVDKVIVLNNLGRLYDDFDKSKEAGEVFMKALGLLRELEHIKVDREEERDELLTRVIILNNLAVTLMKEGQFKDVKERLDEADKITLRLKQELNGKTNPSPYVEEQRKRCKDYESQRKVNRVLLSSVQSVRPLSADINTIKEALPDKVDIDAMSDTDFLLRLKRLNNLAELYRLYQDEDNALNYYRDAIYIAHAFCERYQKKDSIALHPLIRSVLENFEAFMKSSKFSKRKEVNRREMEIEHCKIMMSQIKGSIQH